MKHFIWQAIVTVLLFMAGTSFSQDSSALRHVKVPIANGIYYEDDIEVMIPKAKVIYHTIFRDTGRIVYRDTGSVKYRDTGSTKIVYKCPDEVAGKDILYWSEGQAFGQTFSQFIDACMRSNAVAMVDRDTKLTSKLIISGPLTITSKNNNTIVTSADTGISYRGGGTLLLKNITLAGDDTKTIVIGSTWQDNWTGVIRGEGLTIASGRSGIYTARGGVYDATKDKVLAWAGIELENSSIHTRWVCVASYGQNGPGKYVHLTNVTLNSDSSHTLYFHPNTSIKFDGVYVVNCLQGEKLGKTGYWLHYYSNGGAVNGIYPNARYATIKNVHVGNYLCELGIGNKPVEIDSCTLSFPYTAYVNIRNSTVINNPGYGAYITGSATSCLGEMWPDGNLTITDCVLDALTIKKPCNVTVTNSYVKLASNQGAFPFQIQFHNTDLEKYAAYTMPLTGSKITFDHTAEPVWEYNRKPSVVSVIQ